MRIWRNYWFLKSIKNFQLVWKRIDIDLISRITQDLETFQVYKYSKSIAINLTTYPFKTKKKNLDLSIWYGSPKWSSVILKKSERIEEVSTSVWHDRALRTKPIGKQFVRRGKCTVGIVFLIWNQIHNSWMKWKDSSLTFTDSSIVVNHNKGSDIQVKTRYFHVFSMKLVRLLDLLVS